MLFFFVFLINLTRFGHAYATFYLNNVNNKSENLRKNYFH